MHIWALSYPPVRRDGLSAVSRARGGDAHTHEIVKITRSKLLLTLCHPLAPGSIIVLFVCCAGGARLKCAQSRMAGSLHASTSVVCTCLRLSTNKEGPSCVAKVPG